MVRYDNTRINIGGGWVDNIDGIRDLIVLEMWIMMGDVEC